MEPATYLSSAAVIRNFEEVKVQLAELSDVIIKFKSEQVQLKIVELIFRAAGGEAEDPVEGVGALPSKKRGRRTKKKAEGPAPKADNGKKRAARGDGPVPTLERFIQEGFFSQKRTIGAVVEHCKAKARNLKNNELPPTGALGAEQQTISDEECRWPVGIRHKISRHSM